MSIGICMYVGSISVTVPFHLCKFVDLALDHFHTNIGNMAATGDIDGFFLFLLLDRLHIYVQLCV